MFNHYCFETSLKLCTLPFLCGCVELFLRAHGQVAHFNFCWVSSVRDRCATLQVGTPQWVYWLMVALTFPRHLSKLKVHMTGFVLVSVSPVVPALCVFQLCLLPVGVLALKWWCIPLCGFM